MRGILGDLLAGDDAQRSSAPFLTTSLRNYLLTNKISNQTLGTPQNGGGGVRFMTNRLAGYKDGDSSRFGLHRRSTAVFDRR